MLFRSDKAADVAIAKETTDDERYFATVTDLDFDRATDERVFVLASNHDLGCKCPLCNKWWEVYDRATSGGLRT